jgi:predicted outer membrane repeat protein
VEEGAVKILPVAIVTFLLPAPLMADTIRVPTDQPTIQAGIDAAGDGDVVLVADGTYTGDGNRDVLFTGRDITLRSENGPGVTIVDCEGTEADPHRGFSFYSSDTAVILDGFTIRNGHASNGGGVYCDYYSSPTITNCRIMCNTASVDGGGICCDGARAIIANCEIVSNTAGSEGGGIYCEDSRLTITNCTISGNTAHRGGGLYLERSRYAVVTNTILWGDSPHTIYPGSSRVPAFTYCNVEEGAGKEWFGTGCIEADPAFRDPLAGDFHLLAGSPCIDACPSGPADDIDAEARPFPIDGDYDIGADEFVETDGDGMPDWWEFEYFGSTTAVDPGGDEEPDNLTNLAEYENRTDPLDDDSDDDGLTDGVEVNVYGSNPLDTDTDDDGLTDSEEVTTYATSPTDPDTDHDGRLDGREIAWGSNPLSRWSPGQVTVYVSLTEGDDSYNGRYATHRGGLDGPKATIQAGLDAAIGGDQVLVADGTYTGDGNRDLDFGGKAIALRSDNGAEHTIIDCEGTEAEPHRGVRFGPCGMARPQLHGFTIRNGHADFGGGIFCDQCSKPAIRDCVISGNAAAGGGGVYCEYDSQPMIARCTITGNTADGEGGGLDCWFSKALIVNCLIANNTAEWGGGICHGGRGNAKIVNCTITANTADHAGGIYCYHSEPLVRNCTLSGNTPDEIVADTATPGGEGNEE